MQRADETTLCGPEIESVEWFGALTMPAFLAEVAMRHAANEALVFDDPLDGGRTVRWTYRDLEAMSVRVARALVARSVGKGSRVGILMSNRPEAVAALFGATSVGAVAVPLSTFSTPDELAYLLAHSDTSVLLTQTSMRKRDFLSDLVAVCPEVGSADEPIRSDRLPALRHVAAVGLAERRGAVVPWEAFLRAGEEVDATLVEGLAAGVDRSDHGLIIYSSGTTARPEGDAAQPPGAHHAVLDARPASSAGTRRPGCGPPCRCSGPPASTRRWGPRWRPGAAG